jgi:hypothetical protein
MQVMVEMLAAAIERRQHRCARRGACAGRRPLRRPPLGGLHEGQMRAADHQLQQPLVVSVMDRAGTPGVAHDVEGSGFGFRTVRASTPSRWRQPHSAAWPARLTHRDETPCAPPSNPCRLAIREVANAGLGRSDVLAFWFGESDEVTPASPSATRRPIRCRRRDLLFAQPGPARTARRHRRLHQPAARRGGRDRIAVTSSGVTR